MVRSLGLEGAGIWIEDRIDQSEFSRSLQAFNAARAVLAPKKQRAELALSFLQHPENANLSTPDLKSGLRRILGYTTYLKLGLADAEDKHALRGKITDQIVSLDRELQTANRVYEEELQAAAKRMRERLAADDERAKTTLLAIKNSGLGLCAPSYLISQLEAGLVVPDIGVPFDRHNIDPSTENF